MIPESDHALGFLVFAQSFDKPVSTLSDCALERVTRMFAKQAVVDIDHLSRYTGGDEALNAEVLRLFDSQTSEMVERLHAILDARDTKSWKEVTHSLKGAARGVGAFAFADAAAAAEPIDPVRDRGNASIAIQTLKSSATEVQAFIKTYLDR
jgi:HPt (histidine-containing phosphotransfer) domain-containing protein